MKKMYGLMGAIAVFFAILASGEDFFFSVSWQILAVFGSWLSFIYGGFSQFSPFLKKFEMSKDKMTKIFLFLIFGFLIVSIILWEMEITIGFFIHVLPEEFYSGIWGVGIMIFLIFPQIKAEEGKEVQREID